MKIKLTNPSTLGNHSRFLMFRIPWLKGLSSQNHFQFTPSVVFFPECVFVPQCITAALMGKSQ